MSSWHQLQSQHNEKTSNYLGHDNPKFLDWEIITLFYAALHLVDNYFQTYGPQIPTGHPQRKRLVRQYLTGIASDYIKLFSLSIRARYLVGYNITAAELTKAKQYFSNIQSTIP